MEQFFLTLANCQLNSPVLPNAEIEVCFTLYILTIALFFKFNFKGKLRF